MDNSDPAKQAPEPPANSTSATTEMLVATGDAQVPEPKGSRKLFNKKVLFILGGIVLVMAVLIVLATLFGGKKSSFNMAACITEYQTQKGQSPQAAKDSCVLVSQGKASQATNTSDIGNLNSTDPVSRGKALSNGQCTGTGSKKLGSAPMRVGDVSIVVPYGLLAGGHVTPVDHQYYWGKVQMGQPDMYDVLAPADGHIVAVQYRDHHGQGKVKGDYRVVISYSCTFFSYFDLATSLDPTITAQLPKGWEQANQNPRVNIPIKQGQVIAKMGAQSLDYAVWDTTKTDKNLLVREAYNIAEPWKINTVEPLDYYTDEVKKEVLPLYGRTVEPRDGVIGQDVDGKQVGNWFQEGTYGYAGYVQFTGQSDYSKGHLALVHNLYDPTAFMFSTGSYSSPGDARQFIIKNPGVTPDQADASTKVVKYELATLSYKDETGASWNGEKPVQKVTAVANNMEGTALVQMLESRKIKVEIFPGKAPADVKGFTNAARIYTRGEDAKNSPTIANPGAPTSTATK